jgi:hypothetical protein
MITSFRRPLARSVFFLLRHPRPLTSYQVLAVFVTVPPLITVTKMLPRFGMWFVDLAWVRFITGRRQRPPRPLHLQSASDAIPLTDTPRKNEFGPSRMSSYGSAFDVETKVDEGGYVYGNRGGHSASTGDLGPYMAVGTAHHGA